MKAKEKKRSLSGVSLKAGKMGNEKKEWKCENIQWVKFFWPIPSYFSPLTYYVCTMCRALSLAGSGGASQ
jgi:hypothetical protein